MYISQIFIHLFKLYFFIFVKKYDFKIRKRALLSSFTSLLISCGLSFPLFASISGNNSHLVTSEKLKEVTLSYYQYFPCHRQNCHRHVKGCRVVYRSAVSDPLGHRFFQCTATMRFLRPAEAVKKWQMPDGRLPISTEQLNISNVHSRIIAIRETADNRVLLPLSKQSQNRVTGTFKRYVPDVRQYTFKTIKTGVISKVNATPEHLFYVTDRHRFMPVTDISSQDRLITASGEQVQLLCHPKQKKHCGAPLNRGLPAAVFNFEVNQRHVYFIGDTAIMVHNMCGNDKQKHMEKQEKMTLKDVEAYNKSYSGTLGGELFDPISSQEIPREKALKLAIVNNRGHTVREPSGTVYTLDTLQPLYYSDPNRLNQLLRAHGNVIGFEDSRGQRFNIDSLPNMFFYDNQYQVSENIKYARAGIAYGQANMAELRRERWMLHGMMASIVVLTGIVLGLYGVALFY